MSGLPRKVEVKHAMSLACVFVLSLAFMLCSSALAENERGIAGEGIVLEYELEKPILEDGPQIRDTAYERITIPGLPNLNIPGEPVVPFKIVNVLIPYGEEVQEVKVIPGDEEYLGRIMIEPGQKPLPISDTDLPFITRGEEPTPPNEAIYASLEPFPKNVYLKSGVQSKQGYKILPIILYPIKYVPSTMDTSYFGSFKIEVTTKPSVSLDRGMLRGLAKDKEMVAKLVDNPKEVDTYPSIDATLGVSPLLTGQYDYVIITDQTLKNCPGPYNFQALANWKNSRGVSTAIVTVEEIYPAYNGTDNQEDIRDFIIDAYYSNGVTYVLLGGDADGDDVGWESGDNIVPVRGLWASHDECIPPNIPSDLYYACLDGSYDEDGDGVYGEPNDGYNGVDLFAEVYVGRAPVDSCVEVSNFVRKTIDYESSYGHAYLKKALMVGEDMGENWTGTSHWGGNFKDEIKDSSCANGYCTEGFPYYFDKLTLYDRDYPGNNWPKSELITRINGNIHSINHLGHANNVYDMKMVNNDVDALTNDKYFLGYSQGCYAGAFDNRWFDPDCSYIGPDCILEHFVTGPSGAFAFIGNSRYGWGSPTPTTDGYSQLFDRQFWNLIFGYGFRNIGIANQLSKEINAGSVYAGDNYTRFCYYEINLLGDPETLYILPIEDAEVLLVDKDMGESYETYFEDALSANGISYVTIRGSPLPGDLDRFDCVVWVTGDNYDIALTDDDQINLAAYLDNGGSLFISGQDIGYDVGGTPFYQNYLHAQYVRDDTDILTLNGVGGDPISDSMTIGIAGGDGANNQGWPSEIAPADAAASAVFNYQGDGCGAIKADTGTYKVVYFAFGFEAVNSETARNELMGKVIEYLSCERKPDTSGLFRPSASKWYFNYDNAGSSEYSFDWGVSTDIPVAGDWDGDGNDEAGLFRPSTGTWYFNYDNAGSSEYSFDWGLSTDIPVVGDWDGDGKDEAGLFRPSTGTWFFNYDNAGSSEYSFVWGLGTDVPVAGDWDGDGTDEAGLFRPSTSTWFFNYDNVGSSEYSFVWGAGSDVPVAGDWDDDGKDEAGLFRPSTRTWFFNYDNAGWSEYSFVWGTGSDKPIAGDWDGDGKDEAGLLYMPPTSNWFFNYDNAGSSEYSFVWGLGTDIPVAGDWDGDGNDEAGLFRPSTSTWFFNYDNAGSSEYSFVWGLDTDIPVAGDWDGDGNDEAGLFRPSTGTWFFNYDNAGSSEYSFVWGLGTDIPVVGDWDGDGKDEAGLFRPSTGMWFLNYDNAGSSEYSFVWGLGTDIPVAGDWDGDGKDEAGLFRPSTGMWFLNYDNAGSSEYSFVWGICIDEPIAGKW